MYRDMTQQDLTIKLTDAGIDTSLWGRGKAKTAADLLEEINGGEAELITTADGKLMRKVAVANIDVMYVDRTGRNYRLVESRQVFADGRERARDLGTSVAEKLKSGEDILAAAKRGVEEELGITNIVLESKGTESKSMDSLSYPGLPTVYEIYKFSAVLTNEQYKPEGYVEKTADKTIYFEWEEIAV